ncbi:MULTISPECIES: hypothetical protein [unclassified Streptomyces]|uniref:hypothetical protein n=1 Tax=unclassified Streptomyces TaxID=2593676 RepID=UPI000CD5AD81|nr:MULTISPECIES: hypothetical protein [unclassified Streptomyces]
MRGRLGTSRTGRCLLAAGLGLLVLAAVAALGPLTDWTRPTPRGCQNDLPADQLAAVAGDRSVYRAEEITDARLGEYACVLFDREDRRLLTVSAVSDQESVRSALVGDLAERVDEETSLQALPEPLPGMVTLHGYFHFLPPCPDLVPNGGEFDQRPLVTVRGPSGEISEAALRLAVSAADVAGERLGCGAEPLNYDGRFQPAEPVAAGLLGDSPCEALATDAVPAPRDGRWTVSTAAADTAPAGRCTLQNSDGQTVLVLTSWYGEWSVPILDAQHRWYADSTRQGQPREPYLGSNWAWATAICDGAPAHFGLRLTRPWREFDEPVRHALLSGFAEDQVERRDCHDLRLPAPEPAD